MLGIQSPDPAQKPARDGGVAIDGVTDLKGHRDPVMIVALKDDHVVEGLRQPSFLRRADPLPAGRSGPAPG
jgi:hypothetical protein